jgi:type VI secretion system protein ImpK
MTDDPFAEPTDTDRTMIRPRPGGARPTAPAPQPEPARAAAPAETVVVPSTGSNPLVAAAAPLLAAAIRIAGGRGASPDPEKLRRGMVAEMRGFEKAALATGLDTRALRAARYALCATIDDLVLSTPWGASSSWAQQSLTSIFHSEVTGGDRFFDILDQMQKDLGHNGEVVELMYLCTSLGFEGRYRVMPRGTAALAELRDGVYRLIRERRGQIERDLSPHWRGTEIGHKPLSRRVPLWSIPLATVFLAAMIYLGFNFSLSGSSDIAFAEMYGLPPHGAIVVPRPPNLPPPPPPAPAQTGPSQLSVKLHKFLEPEIRQGLVVVMEDAQSLTVRLTNRNMFALGQASLNPSFPPLITRIAEALQTEPGMITVNGYTDNQPIHTVRFPSNFQLSQERAQAVAAIIMAKLSDPKRVRAVGKADADPIASNATEAGRQQNRRTEIVLTRTSETP